jgi:alanyl-tRNA synthetase
MYLIDFVCFFLLQQFKQDGNRLAVIMNQTIMYPQGGGQPCDTGNIISVDSQQKFRVEDVRSKSGLV